MQTDSRYSIMLGPRQSPKTWLAPAVRYAETAPKRVKVVVGAWGRCREDPGGCSVPELRGRLPGAGSACAMAAAAQKRVLQHVGQW